MKPLTKSRTVNNFYLLVILGVAFFALKYSAKLLAAYYGIGAIYDVGPEAVQPLFVTTAYICYAVVFSTLMALFMEPQLRQDSFGTWSRFGVVWWSCLLCFCWVAQAQL